MRRRNVKHAKERLSLHPELVVDNPFLYKGIWAKLFGNNHPIYLEIGMGKGKFIIEHALKHPEINYIGLEKFDSVLVQAVDKAKSLKLNNLKLIHLEAEKINDVFAEKEINKIFLNFSDPWPKNRHEKRRLTYHTYLALYEKILNGIVEMKTDNQSLFEYSLKSFNNEHWTFLDVSLDLHHRDLPNEEKIITTEYEEKFIQKGNNIYYLEVKK